MCSQISRSRLVLQGSLVPSSVRHYTKPSICASYTTAFNCHFIWRFNIKFPQRNLCPALRKRFCPPRTMASWQGPSVSANHSSRLGGPFSCKNKYNWMTVPAVCCRSLAAVEILCSLYRGIVNLLPKTTIPRESDEVVLLSQLLCARSLLR